MVQSMIINPYMFDKSPLLWWDSSDASTMFLERTGASATTPSTSTGLVGSWKSKGSLENVWAVANADGERPSRNSFYTVVFAAGKGLDAVIPTIPQPFTIIILGLTGAASSGYAIEGQAGTVAWGLIPTNRYTFYAGTDLAVAAYSVGTTYVQTSIIKGSQSKVRRNKSSWTTGNAGAASISTPLRFNMNGAGDKPWATQVAQRMIFSGELSDSEIRFWENKALSSSMANLSFYSSTAPGTSFTLSLDGNTITWNGGGWSPWTRLTGSTDSPVGFWRWAGAANPDWEFMSNGQLRMVGTYYSWEKL